MNDASVLNGTEWVAGAAAAIFVVVQVLKTAFLPDRWAGLVAVLMGLGYGAVLFTAGDVDLNNALLGGVLSGGTAVGVHSTYRSDVLSSTRSSLAGIKEVDSTKKPKAGK